MLICNARTLQHSMTFQLLGTNNQGCQNQDFASGQKRGAKSTIVKSQPNLKLLNYFCRIDIRNCKTAIKIDGYCLLWDFTMNLSR